MNSSDTPVVPEPVNERNWYEKASVAWKAYPIGQQWRKQFTHQELEIIDRAMEAEFQWAEKAIKEDLADELLAEIFCAAPRNPNYVKTVAPKTYEWLKHRIERYPHVARLLRLNGLAAATVGAGLAMAGHATTPMRQSRHGKTTGKQIFSKVRARKRYDHTANIPIHRSLHLELAKAAD